MTRVLIVDDESVFARSTAAALRELGYDCSEAETLAAARKQLAARPCDVVVSDICMAGNDGLEFIASLADPAPGPRVILVTGFPSFDTAIRAIHLHVRGYLVKPVSIRSLVGTIESALAGEPSAASGASAKTSAAARIAAAEGLTNRESQVLDLVSTGYRVPSIADRLGISPHTVRNHLKGIFLKLGVRPQVELTEMLAD